ncbi:MAG: hypothetical protein P8J33_17645, partial [Pirellulaceae bacterium]|nr:hypothetical protein [Pirellulaceae bacterium]
RDGHAAQGVALWTPDDVDVAKSLNRQKHLLQTTARQRWAALTHQGEPIPGQNRIRVALDTTPAGQIPHPSVVTRSKWNIRLLNAMVRSGLLQIVGPVYPEQHSADEDEDHSWTTWEVAPRGDLASDEPWQPYDGDRDSLLNSSKANLESVLSCFRSGLVCDELAHLYQLLLFGVNLGPKCPWFTTNCGGCKACRGEMDPTALIPVSAKTSAICHVGTAPEGWIEGTGQLVNLGVGGEVQVKLLIGDFRELDGGSCAQVLDQLVQQGIRTLFLGQYLLSDPEVRELFRDFGRGIDVEPGLPFISAMSEFASVESRSDLAKVATLIPSIVADCSELEDTMLQDLLRFLGDAGVRSGDVLLVVPADRSCWLNSNLTVQQMWPGCPTLANLVDGEF